MSDLQKYTISYYPTILTPFTEEDKIDYTSLENLIRYFHTLKMDGIFAVCQSSEMFFLSENEKVDLAAFSIGLCRKLGMRCVVSGHTQDDTDAQIAYLKKIEALRPDAVILVSNRFAAPEESDSVFIKNLEKVTTSLKADTRLGIYECPYPYKRSLTETVIKHLAKDARFEFIKDTCGDEKIIALRIEWLKGSNLKLYNASGATLMQSLRDGAAGFSGIHLNVIPELFALLREHITRRPDSQIMYRSAASRMADYIAQFSIMEYQNYPANAKYWLKDSKIINSVRTRNGKPPMTHGQCLQMDALKRDFWLHYAAWLRKPTFEFPFSDGEAFKSCHASTVLPLDGGDVLIAYFAGTYEGTDDVGIWLSAKRNGAWEAPRRIAKTENVPHWNPVLFRTGEGIRVVFKVGKKIEDWKSYTMLSTDEGRLWSTPVLVDAENSAGGPVRSKPLLHRGVLLAPNSDEVGDVWMPRVDLSADDGKTFQKFASIPINRDDENSPDFIAGKGAIQPTLWVDSEDGLHAFIRTTGGRIFRSDSLDSGKTWCRAYATGLMNNNSGIDTATEGNILYLVCNPTDSPMGLRTPLVIWRSSNNGKTFQLFQTLQDMLWDPETSETAEFSYPAMVIQDGILHTSYTYMRRQIGYSAINLRTE